MTETTRPGIEPINLNPGIDPTLLGQALDGAYDLFPDILRAKYKRYFTEDEIERIAQLDPSEVGGNALCEITSEALVVNAHKFDIPAHVEFHFGHAIVNFSDGTKQPSADDTIADLTWGQFNPRKYHGLVQNEHAAHPFVGKRSEIRQLFPQGTKGAFLYAINYAPRSVVTKEYFTGDDNFRKVAADQYKVKRLGQHLLSRTARINPLFPH